MLQRHVEVFADCGGDELEEHRLTPPRIHLLQVDVWKKGDTLAGTNRDGGAMGALDRQRAGEHVESGEATESMRSRCAELRERDLTEDLRVSDLR